MMKHALSIFLLTLLWLVACNTNRITPSPTPLVVENDLEKTMTAVVSFNSTPTAPVTPMSRPRSSPTFKAESTNHMIPPATTSPQATETAFSIITATPVPWHGRLAFASQWNDTNGDGIIGDGDGVNIFRFDIGSGSQTQLTFGDQRDIHPTWSPSGNEIAFVSNRTGNFDLFTVSADGSNMRQLTNTPEDETTPSWSPDGTKIAYVHVTTLESGEQERSLYLITSEGDINQKLPVGPGNIYSPDWSSDGRYLLFERIDELEQDGILRRVTNFYFWDTLTNSLIKLDLEGSQFQDILLQDPKWLPTDKYRLSFSIQKMLSDVPTHQVKVYDLEWENGMPILHEILTLYDASVPYTWGPNGDWYIATIYNGFEGADRYDMISYPIDYVTKSLSIDTYDLLANNDIVANGIYFYSEPEWAP